MSVREEAKGAQRVWSDVIADILKLLTFSTRRMLSTLVVYLRPFTSAPLRIHRARSSFGRRVLATAELVLQRLRRRAISASW